MDSMLEEIKILAVIPARGGSTRIKKKNIAPFVGKPLLAWTIEAAKKSGLFFDILVSTEDEEIAEIAKSWGASVPFLRSQYADSISPVSLAIENAVSEYEKNISSDFEYVAMLMPTCPLRTANDIQQAFTHFITKKVPAQITCTMPLGVNCWWLSLLDEDNKPKKLFPEVSNARSQDLPPLYVPSGAIWLAQKNNLHKEKTFYVNNHIFYPITWFSAFDIDTPEDMELGEKLFMVKNTA